MNNNQDSLIVEQSSNGVARLILNRPEVGNAFDAGLIEKLLQAINKLANDNTRVLQLRSNGRHFSAGADLGWMKQAKELSRQENYEDSRQLAELLYQLNHFPAPTIAVVQGAAYGGAVGLVSACDIAIGSASSRFCLSETRIGLIPAVISPYVVESIGQRQARRYTLSAEIISSEQALQIGLLHELCADQELEQVTENLTGQILGNSPGAIRAAKQLLMDVAGKTIDDELIDLTCQRIADIRVSDEGQEGLSAFLEKRDPAWRQEPSARSKEQ